MVRRMVSHPLAVFLVALFVYLAAPVYQSLDSRYCLMVSQNLIDHGRFRLNSVPGELEGLPSRGNFEVVRGNRYYLFPNGTSLLSVPYVFALNQFGMSALSPEGDYDVGLEIRMQRGLASILMAGLVAIFFLTARLWLPVGWSWLVALTAAFGTSLFSTASRGLWSHTWGVFFLGSALYLLARRERGRALNPFLLATLLSWSYFVRPTFSISVAVVTVLMLRSQRGVVVRYALTGASWLALFCGYSWYNYGRLLPSYYSGGRLGSDTFWTALAGNLVSPSRGVFVYSPFILLAVYLVLRYSRFITSPRLAWSAGAAIVIHLLAVSSFPHWWAGHSYGPRLMTDLVPWLMLLALLGVDAMRRAWDTGTGNASPPAQGGGLGRKVLLGVGVLLLAISLFTHSRGAFVMTTHNWNLNPNVDAHPEKLWDWQSPQFLEGLTSP